MMKLNRRDFLRYSSLTAAGVVMAGCKAGLLSTAPQKKPNVIIYLTDDQGYSDIGFHGNKVIRTPNFDRFAQESTELTRFYVSPVCSPTRASLLTGRYNVRTGVLDTAGGCANINPSETTIAEMLRNAGYRTGIFGKWHLGDNFPSRPMDQGFDESLVIVGGMIGATYNPLSGNSYFDPMLLENGVEKKFSGYAGDVFTSEAIKFVEQNKNRPFFLYLATNDPHHPLTAPDDDVEPYKKMGLSDETARFYGEISNADKNFGRLMRKVDELGLDEDTIVIYMSDNGTSTLLKSEDRYECGLRGRKTYVYENGIRVPCCIRLPANSRKQKKIETIAAHIDILPTIMDACGIRVASAEQIDGISLMPLLTGKQEALQGRQFYIQWHEGDKLRMYRNMAVISQNYKLVQPVGRSKDEDPGSYRFELYDIEKDPFEKDDISSREPHIVERLKADYRAWFEGIGKDSIDEAGLMSVCTARPIIGTIYENPVMLTRQDWRGASWASDKEIGYWEFDVDRAGDYEITIRFDDVMSKDGIVHLKINGQSFSKTIMIAESAVQFSRIRLSSAKTRLDCRLEQDINMKGPRFVQIRCKDIPESVKAFIG